jgi:hypothetical protein
MDKEIGRMKAEHRARLEHAAAEAMRAWERSKEPLDRLTRTFAAGSNDQGKRGEPVETGARAEHVGQTGNVAYLQEYRAALAEIRKIYGADAAQQLDVTTGSKEIQFIEVGSAPERDDDEPV